jgi:hypothetical protein
MNAYRDLREQLLERIRARFLPSPRGNE